MSRTILVSLALFAVACGEPMPKEGVIRKLGDAGGCVLYSHQDHWKEVRFIVCPDGKNGAVHP